MKKRMFFCICALMSVLPVLASGDDCPIILPAVNAVDSIVLWGSDYASCEVHVYNINLADTTRIKFTYTADMNPANVIDGFVIYEQDSGGNNVDAAFILEQHHSTGNFITTSTTGRAQVVIIAESGNVGLYNGVKIWFEAYEGETENPVQILNGNVGIDIQPQEKLHVNGAVRGDGSNGSLRIKTTTGTTEIGSGSSGYSHFYTDRPAFYFSKPLYVNGGVINGYGTDSRLHFRVGGNTDKMQIDGGGVEVLGDLTTENVTAYGTMYVDDTLSLGGPIRGHKTSGSVRIQTDNAWVDIGSTHPAFTHFYTNASKFYFDKPIFNTWWHYKFH